jgi:hypothetical protein
VVDGFRSVRSRSLRRSEISIFPMLEKPSGQTSSRYYADRFRQCRNVGRKRAEKHPGG